MRALIDQILQWPVILQGVLGSALFSVILAIGGFLLRRFRTGWHGFSRRRRLDSLQAEAMRYQALLSEDASNMTVTLVGLMYEALPKIIRALVMICLGLIFGSIVPVFGIVGFAIALFYLFSAATIVRSLDETKSDLKAELTRIEAEIEKLESQT
jgi:hypothetical protein